jgi:hypothetical protein
MNTISKVPGFYAEASLYKTSNQYRYEVFSSVLGRGQGVLPQAMALMKCLEGCHYASSPDYCQQQCFWEDQISGGSGKGGGGKGGGGQSCATGCGPCYSDSDSPYGGYRTCIKHDCSTYVIACRTRPRGFETHSMF